MRNPTNYLRHPTSDAITIGFTKVDASITAVCAKTQFSKSPAKRIARTTAIAYYRQLVVAGWVPVVKA